MSCQTNPNLMQAFQAASIAGGSGSSGVATNNAGMMSETVPRGRGRGVDERAARAAAEVRKKAAAKGLLVRPHGVPVQALPPLTQLLNIINSSAADKKDGDATVLPPNDQTDGPSSQPVQEQHAPVGLGKGLASLDSKKQKSKLKAGA